MPKNFDELDLHSEEDKLLCTLAKQKNIPHLLFVGPSGSGRHTRALCMLKQIYGVNSITPISSTITYTTATQQNELTVLTSPYHLEINPSMVG